MKIGHYTDNFKGVLPGCYNSSIHCVSIIPTKFLNSSFIDNYGKRIS